MEFDIKEIAQLGGVAVVAIGIIYLFREYIRSSMAELSAMRKEREENQIWFQGYVTENNHAKTEDFKNHTQILVDVTKESVEAMSSVAKNIDANTEVTKRQGEILEQHTKILERISEDIRYKLK